MGRRWPYKGRRLIKWAKAIKGPKNLQTEKEETLLGACSLLG